MENHATRGRATGSRGMGRHRSVNRHQNPNFWQNSGQNRQSPATHVQNSGRGRSFRDPATPHSAAPRGYGGDGGSRSGGPGRGGRGGARRPNSESTATTASAATMNASRLARRPNTNSFLTSSTSSGSSATVTHFRGAQNRHRQSHHRWRMLPEVCRLLYVLATPEVCRLLFVLATFIGILFLIIKGRFNEISSFLEVVAVLKNLMLSG